MPRMKAWHLGLHLETVSCMVNHLFISACGMLIILNSLINLDNEVVVKPLTKAS